MFEKFDLLLYANPFKNNKLRKDLDGKKLET